MSKGPDVICPNIKMCLNRSTVIRRKRFEQKGGVTSRLSIIWVKKSRYCRYVYTKGYKDFPGNFKRYDID